MIAHGRWPVVAAFVLASAGLNCSGPQDTAVPEAPAADVQAGESNPPGHVRMLALLKTIA